MPQKIKNLLCHLSAMYPKNGCDKFEVRLEKEINNVATAIVIPIFAAIKGIIGFKKPEYASIVKCPADNVFITFLLILCSILVSEMSDSGCYHCNIIFISCFNNFFILNAAARLDDCGNSALGCNMYVIYCGEKSV